MTNDRGKLQLVLDVGGVLAENLDGFWSGMAEAAGLERRGLRARYKAEIGAELWRGGVSEEAFWSWLTGACPKVSEEEARALLRSVLVPLPALGMLERWSREADIHILSNHVNAWIMPLFEGMEQMISSVVVSSEAGFEKPDLRLFELAGRGLKGTNICFIDDKPANLEAARSLGWDTLLADPEGRWTEEVERRIAGACKQKEE